MAATKTVAEKLTIKPGVAVWTSHPDRLPLVGDLPPGATVTADLAAATIAILFADDAASTTATLEAAKDHLTTTPTIWIAYPKANRTDINRDTLWPMVTPYGLRPNGQIALDDTWSALRFRPMKDGEAPFTGGSKG
jgi:hypothetical protein